jgi:lycopene epsilon-cyclase
VENNPYDPSLMVFMDYRDYNKQKVPCLEAEYPTFLYAMPMSPTRVFFEVYSMYFSCVCYISYQNYV